MKIGEAKSLLNSLSDHFGIERIKHIDLSLNPNVHRGWYSAKPESKIMLAWKSTQWFPLLPSLLHEFAHHLTWCRTHKNHGHDTVFCKNLIEVCKAFYSDASMYAWHREYPSVRAYARFKGVVK